MKKLFLALILVTGLELKAADTATSTNVVKVQTSDGVEFQLPLPTQFGTISDLIESLGNDGDEAIPLANVDSQTLTDALNLYNSGVVPENPDSLANLFRALDFLAAEDFMQKVYIAWLNNPERLQLEVHHHLHGEQLFALMGIRERLLDGELRFMPFSLTAEYKGAITNYQNRQKKSVFIRDLIEAGQLPEIALNGELDLSNKGLVSLDGLQEIPNKENIRILSLNNNQLTGLPAGIFGGLNVLQLLYLGNNQLTNLPAGVFNDLRTLQELYLENNRLTNLPVGIFDGLRMLRLLSLGNNQLADLSVGIFNSLSLLIELHLNDNQLTNLPVGIFDGLRMLHLLNLGNNQFTDLSVGIFKGLSALQWLNLDNNQLTNLPVCIFHGLSASNWVSLKQNPLSPEVLSKIKRWAPRECQIIF